MVWRKGDSLQLVVTVGERENAEVAAADGVRHSHEFSELLGARLAPLDEGWQEDLGLDSDTHGAVILEVDPNGPAAAKGLAAGDVIESIDDEAVETAAEVDKALAAAKNGAALMLVNRDGNERFVAWSSKGA